MSDYLKRFKTTDIEERRKASQRMSEKYPDRCCIIVTKMKGSDVPDIDKHKYLVPRTLSMGQFVYVIRKRISIQPDKALFIYVDNILPSTSELIGNVYNNHVAEDGLLYITYAGESTFG